MHLALSIQLPKKLMEFAPCLAIGNYSNRLANMLSKGGQFNKMAALHGTDHREKDRTILILPHNMVFELFCIDSWTRSRSDINKRTRLFEM